MFHTDFETFSEVDVRAVGSWRYASDPSTEVLSLSYAEDDEDIRLWVPGMKPPKRLIEAILEGEIIGAHNAQFERCVFEYVCSRMGWPIPEWDQMECTAAEAAAMGLPRALDDVTEILGLPHKKDARGKRLINKLCKPQRMTRKCPVGRWYPIDAKEDFEALYEYNIADVAAERDVHHAVRRLTPRERELWICDCIINSRGIHIDLESVRWAMTVLQKREKELTLRAKHLTDGISVTQVEELRKWINARIEWSIPNLQKATIDLLLLSPNLPPNVREVLEIRQQLGLASVKKLNAMRSGAMEDGRVRGTLLYCAAHTGRWGGRKPLQIHNFTRSKMKEDEMDATFSKMHQLQNPHELISKAIRGFIYAERGKVFLVNDYSAIEARIINWLAGQLNVLREFEAGLDTYVIMADEIYKGSRKITETERALGKAVILGCGFGMGVDTFISTARGWGVEVDYELAERAIQAYRQKHWKVKRLWYAYEEAARIALVDKKIIKCNRCVFHYEKPFLFVRLPSGRSIAYPFATISGGKLTYISGKGKARIKTYGGKIAENITQAVARDLLRDAIIRCEREAIDVAFHVHDELINEVLEVLAKEQMKRVQAIMRSPSKWADGLPVEVEGFITRRYRKG